MRNRLLRTKKRSQWLTSGAMSDENSPPKRSKKSALPATAPRTPCSRGAGRRSSHTKSIASPMDQRAISPSPANAVPPLCVIAAAAPNGGVNRSTASTCFAAAGFFSRTAGITLGSIEIERISSIATPDPNRVAINPSTHAPIARASRYPQKNSSTAAGRPYPSEEARHTYMPNTSHSSTISTRIQNGSTMPRKWRATNRSRARSG